MRSEIWNQYKWHEKLVYWTYLWLIRLAYLLRLRGPFNSFQRWLKGEHKVQKTPLPAEELFLTPEGVVYWTMKKFKWRADVLGNVSVSFTSSRTGKKITIPLDYVSDPEVFHTFLLELVERDGDCDDVHFFIATLLARMLQVEEIYLGSCGFRGGGHTFCFYKKDDLWYLVDYRTKAVKSPEEIPYLIARRYSKDKSPVVLFYVVENMRGKLWRAKQIGLKGNTNWYKD